MIKSIETRYAGCRFRSRLEARWAVFFDALELRWSYEPEGFDLGAAGRYLPDFWMPDLGLWIEIKGDEPSLGEMRKARALADGGAPVLLIWGNVGNEQMVLHAHDITDGSAGAYEGRARWFVTSAGPKVLLFNERDRVICDAEWDIVPGCIISEHGFAPAPKALIDAYAAARSARFEHGEKGMSHA